MSQPDNRIAIYWYEDQPREDTDQVTIVRRAAWLESIHNGYCTVRTDPALEPDGAEPAGTRHTLPPGTWSLAP